MKIKDINHIPELKRNLKALKKRKIQVGILGDAEIARNFVVNEFGAKIKITPKMRGFLRARGLRLKASTRFIIIPERATLRTAFDDKKVIKRVVGEAQRIFDVNENPNRIMDRMGILMTAAIQRRIRSNIKPSNHPFTINQKGGKDKTLQNSGRTLRALTHEII